MEEIISVVEEVREENYYNKKYNKADTTRWISLVTGKFDNSFSNLPEQDELSFYSGKELENEIRNTFGKPGLKKYITPEIVNIFWLAFHLRTPNVNFFSTITFCCDPKDNFLLAFARDSNADYSITGKSNLPDPDHFENVSE